MHISRHDSAATPEPEQIYVELDDSKRVYTTHDMITGHVCIEPLADIELSEISIDLVGSTRTMVQKIDRAARLKLSSQQHVFLQLEMPTNEQDLPEDRKLRQSKVYKIPFAFVVPAQLVQTSCQHDTIDERLQLEHRELPPSMSQEQSQTWWTDAVEAACITYAVRGKFTFRQIFGHTRPWPTTLSTAKAVHIFPTRSARLCRPSTTRSRQVIPVKKTLLHKKLGTLVVEARHPKPLSLELNNGTENDGGAEQHPTSCDLFLRFDSEKHDESPPRLGSLSSRVSCCTYYGSTPCAEYPSEGGSWRADETQNRACQVFELPSRSVENVIWQRHENSAADIESESTPPQPSASYHGGPYWASQLSMPISKPEGQSIVPTFYSCLVSRIYEIEIELNLKDIGVSGNAKIKLPLHIVIQGPPELSAPPPLQEEFGSRHGAVEMLLPEGVINSLPDEPLPSYQDAA